MAALNRHDLDPSTNAPNRREENRGESSRRFDRKWANDDQSKGKRQRFEPNKSYAQVSRRDCDKNLFTPLNASVSAIPDKSEKANLLGEPELMKNPASKRNSKKYCPYHRDNGHHIDECRALKQAIENLIQKGHFKEYVDGSTPTREKDQEGNGKKHRGHKGLYVVGTIFGGLHIAGNSRGTQEKYTRKARHEPLNVLSMAP